MVPARKLSEVLRSSGRWARLFLLIVLLPAAVVAVMAVRAFRGEALKDRFQDKERQQHVLRLIETDVDGWLVSQRSHSTAAGVVAFQVRGGEVVLSGWNVRVSPRALEHRASGLSGEESRLLLEAQRLEAQACTRNRAVAAYRRLTATSPHLAAQAHLGLLRLALNAARDEEAFGLVETIRDHDHDALTESGIPVWVAAAVLLAADELRSPLTGMQALLERLEAGKVRDPAMQSRYHSVIRQEVQRLAHMVDNLLDFARLEKNRGRLAR